MTGIIKKVLFGLVLEDAVLREENAYRFYETALQKVHSAEVQALLKKLCAEELRHRLKLEELQRKGVSEELQFSQPEEIELLEQDSQSWPEVRAESSINDILNLALLKEKQAVSYYRLVAGRSALRAVRELFVLLASEEGRHVHWVQKMLAER